MIDKIVFFLEEPSAREMLEGLLPRILPKGVQHQCVVFEGKSDLEKRMGRRLRAWREPNVCFLVMRDQDSADCPQVKQRLVEICREAGKPDTIVRVACRELESWYLADLQAVEAGLGIRGLARQQGRAKYRHPDAIPSPSRELSTLTRGHYQKVAGSRDIGPHLDIANQRSNSFKVLVRGIQAAVT